MEGLTTESIASRGDRRRFLLPDLKPMLLFLLAFFYFLFLLRDVPPVYDDILFASYGFTRFGEIFRFALYYGNGRLIGNLISLLLVSFPVAAPIVKALVLAAFPFLFNRLFELTEPSVRLLAALLLFAMPATLFAQTITWTTAFANYVLPIVLFMALLLTAIHAKPCLMAWALLLVMGVASQLFMEHESILHLAVAGFLTILYSNRRDSRLRSATALLIGTCLGLALMLVIPKLFYRADNTVESYRAVSSLPGLLKNTCHRLIEYLNLLQGYLLLLTVLGGVALYWIRKIYPRLFRPACVAIFSCLLICLLYRLWRSAPSAIEAVMKFACPALIALLLLIYYITLLLCASRSIARHALPPAFAALFALLPLLAVSRSVERCLLLSFVLITAAACIHLNAFPPAFFAASKRFLVPALATALAAFAVYVGIVFADIHRLNRLRNAHAAEAIRQGASVVEIFSFPYDYVHYGAVDKNLALLYCRNKPGDVELIEIDCGEWLEKYGG